MLLTTQVLELLVLSYAVPLPDLVADMLNISPAFPREGDNVHFSAHIALFGPTSLYNVEWGAAIKVRGASSGFVINSGVIPRIDPNTYWTVDAFWQAKQGSWEVWFHADPNNKIAESINTLHVNSFILHDHCSLN